MSVQAEKKVEEKPAAAAAADEDDDNPDDDEEYSLEDSEEVVEPIEVTLDYLVTKFLRGKSIFTISISLACHCGGSFTVSHHFIVFVEQTEMCELYTLINEQKIELTKINENSRQVSVPFLLYYSSFF